MINISKNSRRWQEIEWNLLPWQRYALAAVFGMCGTLALPPYHWLPFAVIGFSGLYILLSHLEFSKKNNFWIGWWFGFGYFTTNLYWIAFALNVDLNKFGWLLIPTAMGLPSILAIFVALVGCICNIRWFASNLHLSQKHLGQFFMLATMWMFSEWLRSWILTGLPLNLVGYMWVSCLSALQVVSFFSIYGLGLLTILLFTLPGFLYRTHISNLPFRKGTLTSLVVMIILPFGYGWWRLHTAPEVQPVYEGVTIRLVQPCIPQIVKLDRTQADAVFAQHLELSKLPSSAPLSAIIWPEVAVSFWVEYDQSRRKVLQAATPKDGLLILGGASRNPLWERPLQVWNSVFFLDDKGEILETYDKSHLVPFGEYMPLRTLLRKFINVESIAAGSVDYSAGPGPRTVKPHPKLPSFSPTVCYEAIFPGEIIDPKLPAEVLINLTNDAWYGDTSGPPQNFAAAQVRAIEEGVPMIRAANNGISGVIDPYGRIIKKLDLNQVGVIDSSIPKPLEVPPLAANFNTVDRLMGIHFLVSFLGLFLFYNRYYLERKLKRSQ